MNQRGNSNEDTINQFLLAEWKVITDKFLSLINKLSPKKKRVVLEMCGGTGHNLYYILRKLGNFVCHHDLSLPVLKKFWARAN